MWFRSLFSTEDRPSSRKTTRRRDHRSAMVPAQRGATRRAADRRGESRRLFLEPLEDRSLMAFNVLGTYATGANPVDIALAQINPGSQLDMVVVNNSDNTVSVRLGNGNGTFGPLQTSSTGAGPNSLATGDFTGDGVTDLVTANAADVTLLAGNGDGTFQAPQHLSLPPQYEVGITGSQLFDQFVNSVATGDLNADGKLDLVVGGITSFPSGYTCNNYACGLTYSSTGYVNVLIGNGTGGFSPAEAHPLATNRLPTALAVGDINSDGKADVISANSGDLSVLLGNGTGALGSPIDAGSGWGFKSISLGDVDGDGKLDTITDGWTGFAVQKGNGDGTFTPQPVNMGIPVASAVMGDVNGDGKIDLIAAGSGNDFHCTNSGTYGCYDGYYTSTRLASVVLGNGSGGFSLPLVSNLSAQSGYSWPADLAVSDLTGDGRPDFVTIDNDGPVALIGVNNGDWNPPPAIAISDAPTIVEGNSGTVNAVFTVSIVGAHSGSVSVDYSTADNTATAGADYTATSGTLTFGPGESTKTIPVPVKGDTLDEFDEQFFVNLSNAVGGQISDSQGTGTIQDDDPAPLVTINNVSKNEGNKNFTSFVFTVSLSAPSGKWVSVNFATADGTAKVSDSDYLATSGNVNFAPGVTTATIIVTVRGDTTKEANETFFVNLLGATNATISD